MLIFTVNTGTDLVSWYVSVRYMHIIFMGSENITLEIFDKELNVFSK